MLTASLLPLILFQKRKTPIVVKYRVLISIIAPLSASVIGHHNNHRSKKTKQNKRKKKLQTQHRKNARRH